MLVSAAWLAGHLQDPDLVVADVRWYLDGRRGIDAYRAGHVPGAQFVDLDGELAGPPGPRGRHPLPEPTAVAALLSRLGAREDSTVVAYDDAGGAIAARLWWLLRWVGLDGGRVLDGGIQAWIAAGGALETQASARPPAPPLELEPRPELLVDADALAELSARGEALLLDARAPERYAGEIEPIDPRAGHIPGARNAPFADNFEAPEGALLPPEALRARYAALGVDGRKPVVCYCGSGVTACLDILALARAGYPDALLYPGSWSEWSADPRRPLATGRDPGSVPSGARM